MWLESHRVSSSSSLHGTRRHSPSPALTKGIHSHQYSKLLKQCKTQQESTVPIVIQSRILKSPIVTCHSKWYLAPITLVNQYRHGMHIMRSNWQCLACQGSESTSWSTLVPPAGSEDLRHIPRTWAHHSRYNSTRYHLTHPWTSGDDIHK